MKLSCCSAMLELVFESEKVCIESEKVCMPISNPQTLLGSYYPRHYLLWCLVVSHNFILIERYLDRLKEERVFRNYY